LFFAAGAQAEGHEGGNEELGIVHDFLFPKMRIVEDR
jgi:hypothetical protein